MTKTVPCPYCGMLMIEGSLHPVPMCKEWLTRKTKFKPCPFCKAEIEYPGGYTMARHPANGCFLECIGLDPENREKLAKWNKRIE